MKFLNENGLTRFFNNIKTMLSSKVSSSQITEIRVVDELPGTEVEGVLYLLKGIAIVVPDIPAEPAITNLYPVQIKETQTSGNLSVEFENRQVKINGLNSSSLWGWTKHFEMPLVNGKSYNIKLTNVSGNFDNSARLNAGSDDVIIKILLYGYLADNTEVSLKSKELNATQIYENQTINITANYEDYYFSIQAKGNVDFDNLILDISITEVAEV